MVPTREAARNPREALREKVLLVMRWARRLAASLQLTAAGVRRIAVGGLTILWSVRGIVRVRGTAGIVGRIVTKCIALQA